MRVTSEQLPVNTANGGPYLHKPEYSGRELDSRQAGLGGAFLIAQMRPFITALFACMLLLMNN